MRLTTSVLKVDLEIKAVSSLKTAVNDNIIIQWLRGPFTAETKTYSFMETVVYNGDVSKRPGKKIQMAEDFSKISSFYYHPKSDQWQPKECIFKILSRPKDGACTTRAVKKFNMSTCIGTDGVFQLDMDKGFYIDIVMKIEGADPTKDKELIEEEAQARKAMLLVPGAPTLSATEESEITFSPPEPLEPSTPPKSQEHSDE